jgi:phosphatidylinositol 4-kinase
LINYRIANPPQSLPELEALLALCKASSKVTSIEIAAQLLAQLTSYLPESHVQVLAVPQSLELSSPSPWEALSANLTGAVLILGLNHPSLRHHAASTVSRYVFGWFDASRSCAQAQLDANDEDMEAPEIRRIIALAVSLLGFLESSAKHAHFWTPKERLQLVTVLRDALSDDYMVALETALSLVRNARHSQGELKTWKHYSRKYAASGRPLGAMLLRLGFMEVITAFASLEITGPEVLEDQDILEVLIRDSPLQLAGNGIDGFPIERLAEISADELKLLEEGDDYLQLGSAWQQRLASAVKALAFKCLLCCAILDEETAEPEALLMRLEATMFDPNQILDEYLASVVFKSMAILSKASPLVASNVSRSLCRIIVQGGLDSKTASVAAQCLASVLRRLPQDATITTLYSLGNLLSARGTQPDRTLTASPHFENAAKSRGQIYPDVNGNSVVSLGPSMAEEPSLVFLITIEAIVRIACTCGQDKIIALALSMLIQKIGRLNLEVDAKIITETAILGVHSAVNELRSLLKLYSKLSHDGLVQENATIIDAVGLPSR